MSVTQGNRSLYSIVYTIILREQLTQRARPLQTPSLALQATTSVALYSPALAGPTPVSVLLLQLWGEDEGPGSAAG